MQLEPEEVEQFYAAWKPPLLFVNRGLRLVSDLLAADFAAPSADFERPWDIHHDIRKGRG